MSRRFLKCLRANSLFCSPKKTNLSTIDFKFLSYRISRKEIKPNEDKVKKVLKWLRSTSATDVRGLLGMVWYIANHLPELARHTSVLTSLTTKEAERNFVWRDHHSLAFDMIEKLVLSPEVLTVIDHNNIEDDEIFVACDASDTCTGAVLSYGKSLQTAPSVAFESQQLRGAELNYPVHEKDLSSIIRALKKWRTDLLGVPILIYTDLENFDE